jgi:hypothetical protein
MLEQHYSSGAVLAVAVVLPSTDNCNYCNGPPLPQTDNRAHCRTVLLEFKATTYGGNRYVCVQLYKCTGNSRAMPLGR